MRNNMEQDSLYVVIPIALMQELQAKYEAKGFVNRGSVRYSLDETQVLLEESNEMFEAEDLTREGVLTFTQEEMLQYLRDNKVEWEEELEI